MLRTAVRKVFLLLFSLSPTFSSGKLMKRAVPTRGLIAPRRRRWQWLPLDAKKTVKLMQSPGPKAKLNP